MKTLSKDELFANCGFQKQGDKYIAEDVTVTIDDGKIQIITHEFENLRWEPKSVLTAPVPIELIQFKSKNLPA